MSAPCYLFLRSELAKIAQRRRPPEPRRRKPFFEHFFVQYGAGAHLFGPLTRWRYWNRFCWIVIVVGILGWILAFWLLRSFTE